MFCLDLFSYFGFLLHIHSHRISLISLSFSLSLPLLFPSHTHRNRSTTLQKQISTNRSLCGCITWCRTFSMRRTSRRQSRCTSNTRSVGEYFEMGGEKKKRGTETEICFTTGNEKMFGRNKAEMRAAQIGEKYTYSFDRKRV